MTEMYASKRKGGWGVLVMKCPRELRHTVKREGWIHVAYSNGVKRILWRPYLGVCFALGSPCKCIEDRATPFFCVPYAFFANKRKAYLVVVSVGLSVMCHYRLSRGIWFIV